MTTGLTRNQIGLTEAMIAAFGDRIWELSTNIQLRRGDPVRLLQLDEIDAQRPAMGMSDAEIAAAVGLSFEQVRFIRVLLEHRKFRRQHYNRLFAVGPGERFRRERFVPAESRTALRAEAMAVRGALSFDPRNTSRYLVQGWWNADTVTAWLDKWATNAPERSAIRWRGGSLSYAETRSRAQRLAAALLDLGVAKGDVVAIQLPNVPEFLIAYFAVTMFGGIVSTLHMPYRASEMEPLLRHAAARAVICSAVQDGYDAPATFLDLKTRVPSLEHVIVAGDAVPPGALALSALIASATPREIEDPPVAADPAILCFTSGTSSAPKAVVHTYQTMLANNRLCAPIYGLGATDVLLSGPPFTHAFGICMINYILFAGGTNYLMPSFSPSALIDALADGSPTVFYCAPAHIAACRKAGLFENRRYPSPRIAVISGSACPPDIADALAEILPNGKVGQMWGMTEMFMGLLNPPGDSREERHNTLGKATPGTELRLVREDGTLAAAEEEGEIEVRGPSVIPGYFGNDAATRLAFGAEGWFKTGDIAKRRADGNYVITGRVKDIINRGGIKINPIDIEVLMDRHPAVLQSAVAPVPDPVLGEKACLFAVVKPGAHLTLAEACDYLAANNVAKLRWPERLEIIDAMPMTPTRKIIKGELTRRVS